MEYEALRQINFKFCFVDLGRVVMQICAPALLLLKAAGRLTTHLFINKISGLLLFKPTCCCDGCPVITYLLLHTIYEAMIVLKLQ